MTEHIWHGPQHHTAPEDPPDSCTACVLSLCVVCGGAEASLPDECPGRKMTNAECDAVQGGTLNFKDGQWHRYRG